jgi:DNA-binding GntR family transcriptional regulator
MQYMNSGHAIQLTESVHSAIEQAILSGRFEPDTRVNQDALARELGVSRTPVREALRWLERDGLIRLEPRRGAFVASYSAQDVFEIYELRELLEPHAAAIACVVATRADAARIADLAAQIEQAAGRDVQAAFALNRSFHQKLCEPCRNALLTGLLEQVWSQQAALRIFTYYAGAGRELAARTHAQHRAIVDAFCARDQDHTRDLVRNHIAEAHEATVRLMQADGLPIHSGVA